MTIKTDIWMPLYIGDYLAGTSTLTTELHGAYLLLIMHYWMVGPPPDDDARLAAITRMTADAWSNARAVLEEFFIVSDGRWLHKRVEQELSNACEKKRLAAEKASKAAAARWHKRPQAMLKQSSSIPQAVLDECPSPSPSPPPPDQEQEPDQNPLPEWEKVSSGTTPAHANGEDF